MVLNIGSLVVIWYQQNASYADSKSTADVPMWYLVKNKEVPDRNIGVPMVRNYANYRTLSNFVYRDTANFRPTNG
jgi:hypothetical protein